MFGARFWKWFKFSPLLAFALLLLVNVLVSEGHRKDVVGVVWFVVAIVSLVFADRVRARTKLQLTIAREDGVPNCWLYEVLHTLAVITELLHLVNASVGFMAVFLPEDHWFTELVATDTLLLGQYLLLLIVMLTYLMYRTIELRSEESE
jgi:hypothetical protein